MSPMEQAYLIMVVVVFAVFAVVLAFYSVTARARPDQQRAAAPQPVPGMQTAHQH